MNSRIKKSTHKIVFRTTGFLAAVTAGCLLLASPALAGGDCPQPRKTKSAPANLAKMAIPGNADAALGEKLFQKGAKPMACKMCHGKTGAGNGKLGKALKPEPRNFTCSKTMEKVSPGQMFWIIKDGSKGTGMVAHKKTLKDKDIWSLVKYINTEFAKR